LEPSFDLDQHKTNFLVKKIFTLEEGNGFGELAIVNDGKRTCSVISDGDSILLSLTRDKFRDVCGNIVSSNVKMKADILKSTDVFKNLSEDSILKLSSCLEFKRFEHGTILQQSDELIKQVIIILNGIVSVERRVNKSIVLSTKLHRSIAKEIKSIPESLIIEVEKIGERGTIIGFMELLKGTASKYTYRTFLPINAYTCTAYDFIRYIGVHNMDLILYKPFTIVDDIQLLNRHIKDKLWDRLRPSIISSYSSTKSTARKLRPSASLPFLSFPLPPTEPLSHPIKVISYSHKRALSYRIKKDSKKICREIVPWKGVTNALPSQKRMIRSLGNMRRQVIKYYFGKTEKT